MLPALEPPDRRFLPRSDEVPPSPREGSGSVTGIRTALARGPARPASKAPDARPVPDEAFPQHRSRARGPKPSIAGPSPPPARCQRLVSGTVRSPPAHSPFRFPWITGRGSPRGCLAGPCNWRARLADRLVGRAPVRARHRQGRVRRRREMDGLHDRPGDGACRGRAELENMDLARGGLAARAVRLADPDIFDAGRELDLVIHLAAAGPSARRHPRPSVADPPVGGAPELPIVVQLENEPRTAHPEEGAVYARGTFDQGGRGHGEAETGNERRARPARRGGRQRSSCEGLGSLAGGRARRGAGIRGAGRQQARRDETGSDPRHRSRPGIDVQAHQDRTTGKPTGAVRPGFLLRAHGQAG